MASTLRDSRPAARGLARRLVLFVCSGNTSRSPMAQALCNDEILRRLGLSAGRPDELPVRAVSAGLTARPGRRLSADARAALQHLGVTPHEHWSLEVSAELVERAERIYCMTDEQCRGLVGRYPAAAAKVQRLDPDADLEDPGGQDLAVFLALAARLQGLVRRRIAEMVPA